MFSNNLYNNHFFPHNNYSYGQSKTYQNDNRSIIINKLLNDENNYICFDCHKQANGLKYFDLKNAIFLCYNCSIQHLNMPKEISEIMTGDIRNLDEKYLLPLYYGGNKNLILFIRRYFPLLEKMEIRNMYSTVAMDYYRKLIKAKICNMPEPYLPRKFEGYNSIYRNIVNPANEFGYNNLRNNFEEEKNNDLYGNNIFNNNISQNKFRQNEDENICNKDKDDDIEMKDIKDEENKDKDNKFIQDEINLQEKERNIKNQEIERNDSNYLNINQMGNLNMYPDAKEFDELDS